MSQLNCFITMGLGGFFILLGIVLFLWARGEERGLNRSLSRRRGDLREFLTRWPERIQPGALRVGGWTSMAVGLVLIIMGSVFLL